MLFRAVLIAAAIATAAAPAVAHAAPVEDFLNQMVADNITSSKSPEDLVKAARGACEMLTNENGQQVSEFIYQETDLDLAQSLVFVADAMHYFCPWQDHTGGQLWQATHPGGDALQ
ncbi:DUF732 domain-containing protein [Mycobacterium colombiense]|uniref:DUF732 domain-containing protein n=1 Tax=Mycobacterium colombiense TaxID=339268 RepID=UPI00200AC4F6|nr:DUF732 domain-containing protein [Mycobacterium colombiense]MCK8643113.1 DUF732 domain-containing protein [Mycobacterium colombiense]